MSAFRQWLVGLTFALLTADTACTTGQPEKGATLVIDSASLNERDMFNVRFKKVDIRACKIWDVLVSLAEEIEKSSGGKRHFEVFLESSRTGKYLDKHSQLKRRNGEMGSEEARERGQSQVLTQIIQK